jgi:hypothetical protein
MMSDRPSPFTSAAAIAFHAVVGLPIKAPELMLVPFISQTAISPVEVF